MFQNIGMGICVSSKILTWEHVYFQKYLNGNMCIFRNWHGNMCVSEILACEHMYFQKHRHGNMCVSEILAAHGNMCVSEILAWGICVFQKYWHGNMCILGKAWRCHRATDQPVGM